MRGFGTIHIPIELQAILDLANDLLVFSGLENFSLVLRGRIAPGTARISAALIPFGVYQVYSPVHLFNLDKGTFEATSFDNFPVFWFGNSRRGAVDRY